MQATPRTPARRHRIAGAATLLITTIVASGLATEPASAVGGPAAPWDLNGDGFPDVALRAPYDDFGGVNDAGVLHLLAGGPGLDESEAILVDHAALGLVPVAEDRLGWSVASADFDVDGFADLAIGMPMRDHGPAMGQADSGVVVIVPGSSDGPDTGAAFVLEEGTNGLGGVSAGLDSFGWTLAAGDFDGDDAPDLAIGELGADDGPITNGGSVHVVYGGTDWTAPGFDQSYVRPGLLGLSNPSGDGFSYALSAGDFDGDGDDDLAGSAPFGDRDGDPATSDTGYVVVVRGTPSGLSNANPTVIHPNSPGIAGSARTGDYFGLTLASGELVGDGRDDLVIGVPERDIGAQSDAGVVHVLAGTASGITSAGAVVLNQNVAGVGDTAEPNEGFGIAFGTGDVNGDGHDDLVVGVPGEDAAGNVDTGAFHVLYGGAGGVSGTGSKVYTRASTDVAGDPLPSQLFGSGIVVRDWNGNGKADVAVAAVGDDVLGNDHAGSIHLFRGTTTGLSVTNDRILVEIAFGDGPQPFDGLTV